MRVLAYDVRPEVISQSSSAEFVSWNDSLAEADFLCLACNLTAENRHMIDAEGLANMKTGAHLVNISRGALVDEDALMAALGAGRLAGAALDVYEVEPLPEEHPLKRLDNVVLGSHNANNVKAANDMVLQRTIASLVHSLRR
jgi:D-3-phosphoglycerate dehydrogenase